MLPHCKISLPLHSVISFSVINYVVMMRHPRVSDEVSFCFSNSYIFDKQLVRYKTPAPNGAGVFR